jgi:hypothetical protein
MCLDIGRIAWVTATGIRMGIRQIDMRWGLEFGGNHVRYWAAENGRTRLEARGRGRESVRMVSRWWVARRLILTWMARPNMGKRWERR